jgi:hypothetical protein
VSGCSSGSTTTEPGHRHALDSIVALHERGGLLGQRGYAIGPVAATSRYVAWAAAPGDEADDVLLLSRDLRTGATRVLAHRLFEAFGLATAAGSVVYATASGASAQLEARPPEGGPPRVLSRALGAPFDARGEVVAWAESDATRNRVLFRNLRTGRSAVVFSAPRCRGNRCYRIDRVTVADRGVVFDLGSVGQGYPSLIVRRSWSAKRPSFVRVPSDPQPDVARASAGALYYRLGHGWMEWNFGRALPAPTWPHRVRPWLLSRDGTRSLVITGRHCATSVAARFSGGRTIPLPLPHATAVTTTRLGKVCRQLTGFAWSRPRLLLAWTLTPQVSVEAHEEIGVSGVITATVVR